MKFTHLLTTMCAMSLVSYGEEKQTNLFDYNISVDKKTPPLLPFFREMPMYRALGDGSSCSNYSRMSPFLLIIGTFSVNIYFFEVIL